MFCSKEMKKKKELLRKNRLKEEKKFSHFFLSGEKKTEH